MTRPEDLRTVWLSLAKNGNRYAQVFQSMLASAEQDTIDAFTISLAQGLPRIAEDVREMYERTFAALDAGNPDPVDVLDVVGDDPGVDLFDVLRGAQPLPDQTEATSDPETTS